MAVAYAHMRRSFTVALLLALLASCSDKPGEWSLFVYPDAHDRAHWTRTDRFQNEAMCKQAGAEAMAGLTAKAGYQCVHTGPPS